MYEVYFLECLGFADSHEIDPGPDSVIFTKERK